MGDEGAGEAGVVGGEAGGQLAGSVERPSVAEFAGGVDLRAKLVFDAPRHLPFLRRDVALAIGAIAGAEAADRVERLEREAGRIDLGVAGRAVGVGAMLGQLLADCGGTTGVRVDRGNAGRRRRRRIVEEAIGDPDAAFDGRGGRAVGSELMNGRLAEESATQVSRGQHDLTSFDAADTADAVMLGKTLREHREVRLQERPGREVMFEQLGEQCGRFAGDAFAE